MKRFTRIELTLQSMTYVGLVLLFGLWRGPLASRTLVGPTDPVSEAVAASPGTLTLPLPVSDVVPQSVPADGLKAILPAKGQAFGSILMYHYVRSVDSRADPLGFRLSVISQELDKEVASMKMAGYSSISIDDYLAGKGDAKSVVMTFDDGYADFYTDAYPILKKYGWSATAYIITGKVGHSGYLTWTQIRALRDGGIEIGAHTVDHNDLSQQTPDAQYHEIFDSKATLEKQLGQTVTAFCYPSGRYSAVTESLVQQAGFTSATTTHPGLASKSQYDPFQLPRIRIQPPLSVDGLLRELAH